MSSTEIGADQESADSSRVDRDAIRRRRRWLYAFTALALIAVCAFGAMQLLQGDPAKEAEKKRMKPPVIVERFELNPVRGQSGRGLAELVRRESGDGLRVLAANLKPNLDNEVYQLLLAGGQSEPKLLGNEVVGQQKTFVGEAKVSAAELHQYRRIELRRVGRGNPPVTKLVLRGSIPR
jgi:hypothetical protein